MVANTRIFIKNTPLHYVIVQEATGEQSEISKTQPGANAAVLEIVKGLLNEPETDKPLHYGNYRP
jgi:hypothetical protein